MSEKRYAAVKRVNLSGVSEEWDESCFAYVVPATYGDSQRTIELNVRELSPQEQIDYQLQFVADHFISGKIKVFDGSEFVLADMTSEDTAASIGVADHLYAEIMGFDLDPKGIRKAVLDNALQKNDENNTPKPSSTDQPAE